MLPAVNKRKSSLADPSVQEEWHKSPSPASFLPGGASAPYIFAEALCKSRPVRRQRVYKCILVIVQRILGRRVWRWIRRRKLPDELISWICGGVDVILFARCIISQIRWRRSRWHLRATTLVRIGRRDDRRDRRRCRLNNGRFRMHNIRMILPFPQFAADKPNRDHRSVAPHHLSLIFQVQLRELLANLWCNFRAVFVRLVRVENFNGFRRKNRSKPNGKKTRFFLCEVNKGIRQATRSSPVFIFSLPSLSLSFSLSIPLLLSQTSLFHRGFVKLLLQANSVPCKNHLLSFKTSPFQASIPLNEHQTFIDQRFQRPFSGPPLLLLLDTWCENF